MNTKNHNILISGARAPIALEMARSFKKAGCRVIMLKYLHTNILKWWNREDNYYIVVSQSYFIHLFVKKIQAMINYENIFCNINYFEPKRNFIQTKLINSQNNLVEFPNKRFVSDETDMVGKYIYAFQTGKNAELKSEVNFNVYW